MIDWQMFFSFLAALLVFRAIQEAPKFISEFMRGYRDARRDRLARSVLEKCSKNDRYPFGNERCNYSDEASMVFSGDGDYERRPDV